MSDFEEIEEELEEEELEEKGPQAIKRKFEVVEKELKNTSNLEWDYSRQLLKVGMATYIFGISFYMAAIMILKGPFFILKAPPIIKALLIAGGAVPVLIFVYFVQWYRRKVNRLERIRKQLLSNYKSGLLKEAEDDNI